MRTIAFGFACALALASGCSKPEPSAGGAAASASAAGEVAARSGAPGASAPVAGRATAEAFAGPYVSKVGAVEPPAAAKEKAWTDDPGTAAVGPGTIELSVDAAAGDKGPLRKVSGEIKGALGHLLIAGTFDGHDLRANVAPEEPNQPGAMTGYLALTAEGPTKLKGILRVASGNARIVREAPLDLTRK